SSWRSSPPACSSSSGSARSGRGRPPGACAGSGGHARIGHVSTRTPMKPGTYDFRQFQEELAALDRKNQAQDHGKLPPEKESAQVRLARAKAEFTALRERYGLTVAHVIAFFPEEDGVAYLQGLITGLEAKP